MEEKLTLKRTFELCKEMWSWLAKNPTMRKHDWPELPKYGILDCNCFACEYITQKYKTCKECPLKKLWIHGCQSTADSPYRMWGYAHNEKEKRIHAQRIVDFCDKELKKLNRKGIYKCEEELT